MRLKRPSVHVARAIDRALSGEMVKTLTPAARGDGDGAPRHVKHAHKAKKPDALVLAFQQALLRNPAPGAFHPPPARCGVRAPLNPTPSTRRPVVSPRRRHRGGRRTPSTRRPVVNSPLATQALAPAAAAGRNRRRAKMLMVRKKTKSYANAQGIKAVSTKRPLGVRKR